MNGKPTLLMTTGMGQVSKLIDLASRVFVWMALAILILAATVNDMHLLIPALFSYLIAIRLIFVADKMEE